MEVRIIKAPSEGVKEILKRRIDHSLAEAVESADAVGLMQGRLIDMVFAIDIAEKTSGVNVADVRGNCPQNVVMTAVFGETSSVEAAMSNVRAWISEGFK